MIATSGTPTRSIRPSCKRHDERAARRGGEVERTASSGVVVAPAGSAMRAIVAASLRPTLAMPMQNGAASAAASAITRALAPTCGEDALAHEIGPERARPERRA